MAEANQQAGECRECGECESKCPQAIPIMKWLSVAHKVLGEKQPYAAKLE
jgi:predicted aldo/keto reductase-like oxidoreductase